MGNVVVGIHQPNFMPWLGYFYKIYNSDIFIFLDDVQFSKKGATYTNRVAINVQSETKFLTVPINRPSGFWNINETISKDDNNWRKKTISTLKFNYSKAPFFNKNKEFVFGLIENKNSNLSEYNIDFIKKISEKLSLKAEFKKSSDYNIEERSTDRLIKLVKSVKGSCYISGGGGDKYQDKELYDKNDIKIVYNRLPKFEYEQVKTEQFIGSVSIIDAIFNIGFEKLKSQLFIKNENE